MRVCDGIAISARELAQFQHIHHLDTVSRWIPACCRYGKPPRPAMAAHLLLNAVDTDPPLSADRRMKVEDSSMVLKENGIGVPAIRMLMLLLANENTDKDVVILCAEVARSITVSRQLNFGWPADEL